MTNQELLVQAWDSALWELSEAFVNLPDGEVWKRPHPRLLSIGEIAAHIAFGEASSFFDPTFETAFSAVPADYYLSNVDKAFSLPLGATALLAEIQRIHEACKNSMSTEPRDLGDANPHREGWSWTYTMQYQTFHVAYHTGQIYSVRHMLGHETVDN